MKIEKLSECKTASRFGTCTECGANETNEHNLRRLKFNGVSVCLCQDCFSKVKREINNITDLPSGGSEKETGEWLNIELIPNDITGHAYGECSVCQKVRIVDNYCPNCGIKMKVSGYDT